MFNYWQQFKGDEQILQDLLWDRPQNNNNLPKVALLSGGGQTGFVAGEKIYQNLKAHKNQVKLILPDWLRASLPDDNPDLLFLPSNKLQGFEAALTTQLQVFAKQNYSIVLSSDIATSSNNVIAIENYLQLAELGPIFIKESALLSDHILDIIIEKRLATTFVVTDKILQKLVKRLPVDVAILSDDQRLDVVKKMQKLSDAFPYLNLIQVDSNSIIASNAQEGVVSYESPRKLNCQIAGSAVAHYPAAPILKNLIATLGAEGGTRTHT